METAKHFGIDEDHAVNYVADSAGIKYSSELILDAASIVRAGGEIGRKWKERAEADYRERSGKAGRN